jgi:hypothetical protein
VISPLRGQSEEDKGEFRVFKNRILIEGSKKKAFKFVVETRVVENPPILLDPWLNSLKGDNKEAKKRGEQG